MSGRCEPVLQVDALTAYKSCSDCALDTDCSAGQVCGVEAGSGMNLYLGCGAPGRHLLGERCQSDAECATGQCCESVCSQCCTAQPCTSGQICDIRRDTLGLEYLPWQCAPGAKGGAAGEPCLFDDDCASGSCSGSGPLQLCTSDGRRCEQDSDCGTYFWGETACLPLGQRGGSCD